MEWSNDDFEAIADGCYVARCQPEGVNVGLVVGTRAALLVDAGATPDQGAALLEAASKMVSVPVTHAVITHGHFDHFYGVPGLAGVRTVAHEGITSVAPQNLAAVGLDALPSVDETFSMVWSVDLGDQRVEVLHFGAAHTDHDALVWVPGPGVCFMGDVVEQSGDPQFDDTSNVANWPMAVDGILSVAKDDVILVPGHGTPVDKGFGYQQCAKLAMLHSETRRLIEQGTPLDEAYTACDWPFTSETLQTALPLLYRQFESQGIKPRTHLPLV